MGCSAREARRPAPASARRRPTAWRVSRASAPPACRRSPTEEAMSTPGVESTPARRQLRMTEAIRRLPPSGTDARPAALPGAPAPRSWSGSSDRGAAAGPRSFRAERRPAAHATMPG
jgi:hypothetical protein